MSKKGVLSSKFNMSLGFIPVIVSIVLCEFTTQDISIYIGAGVGVLYSLYTMWGKGAKIPNFLLYLYYRNAPAINFYDSIIWRLQFA